MTETEALQQPGMRLAHVLASIPNSCPAVEHLGRLEVVVEIVLGHVLPDSRARAACAGCARSPISPAEGWIRPSMRLIEVVIPLPFGQIPQHLTRLHEEADVAHSRHWSPKTDMKVRH